MSVSVKMKNDLLGKLYLLVQDTATTNSYVETNAHLKADKGDSFAL